MSLVTDDPKIKPAELLLKKLPQLSKKFSKRSLQRKEWAGLVTKESCQEAIDCLLEHGYLKEVIELPHGRPKTSYLIHPSFRQ